MTNQTIKYPQAMKLRANPNFFSWKGPKWIFLRPVSKCGRIAATYLSSVSTVTSLSVNIHLRGTAHQHEASNKCVEGCCTADVDTRPPVSLSLDDQKSSLPSQDSCNTATGESRNERHPQPRRHLTKVVRVRCCSISCKCPQRPACSDIYTYHADSHTEEE